MDDEYEKLMQALREARDNVIRDNRRLPAANVLELRLRSYRAWQALENHRGDGDPQGVT